MAQVDARLVRLGNLPPEIRESSGVAISRRHEGVFWTHNDSGGTPSLFAVSTDGRILGELRLEGVQNRDWEDLSLGPCPRPSEADPDCLYVADIGDNAGFRRSVSVHVVVEPDTILALMRAEPLSTSRLRYADGPADAEAFAVAPDGSGLIITKGQDGSARAYAIELGSFSRAEEQESRAEIPLRAAATLPIDVSRRDQRVTGASISRDGATLAVRTRSAIYLFEYPIGAAEAIEVRAVCRLGRAEPQGEAIDFFADGALLLTSEAGRGMAPIHLARCPPDPVEPS